MSKKQVYFMQGNEACARGAIAAGANFFAGYPITPATEVAELLAKHIPSAGGVFMQMEDELGCMGAVCGASQVGAKPVLATSGPGFTLIQENLGYAVMAELPCVIISVQRGGPSTGLPTFTSQGDVMISRWGTHGDHAIICLCPNSVYESYMLTVEAFNLAEKYRTPVILLTDAAIGHMREKIEIPADEDLDIVNREKPSCGPDEFKPYDYTKGSVPGVPPMANFGEGYRYYVSGCIHDEAGNPRMNSPEAARNLVKRFCTKIEDNADDICRWEERYTDTGAKVMVLAYGSVSRPAAEAVEMAREAGKNVSYFRPITLWPSPAKALLKAAEGVDTVIVAEMNNGQYAGEIMRVFGEAEKNIRVVKLEELGGEMIAPKAILKLIEEVTG